MDKDKIKKIIDSYVAVSFSVTRKTESLIKGLIGEDLTCDQYYTLRHIQKSGGCTSTELADVFIVKKSAITAIITRLDDKGLIKRTRDENDRRVVHLTLTEKGRNMYLQTGVKIEKLVESFITRFEHEEIEAFIKTYEKLSGILEELQLKQEE